MKTKSLKKAIWLFILSAFLIAAIGFGGGATFRSFFEELNIVPTGISGFSMLVSHWLEGLGISLPTSVIYLILCGVICAVSFKFFGWKFVTLSGIGLGAFTLGMQFCNIPQIAQSVNNDMLLLCIVGSIILGLVVGSTIKLGGSTGGSDIMGKMLSHAFPKIKTGSFMLIINVFVILLSVLTFGLQTGLYALLNAIISALVTNMVLDSSNKVVAYHIICSKPEEISKAIFSQYHRGVTRLDGTGMFTGNEKAVLLCLLPYEQSFKLREFVLAIDAKAFVYSTPVTQTIGENNFMTAPLPDLTEEAKQALIETTTSIQQNEIAKAEPTMTATIQKVAKPKPAAKTSASKTLAKKNLTTKKTATKKATAKTKNAE